MTALRTYTYVLNCPPFPFLARNGQLVSSFSSRSLADKILSPVLRLSRRSGTESPKPKGTNFAHLGPVLQSVSNRGALSDSRLPLTVWGILTSSFLLGKFQSGVHGNLLIGALAVRPCHHVTGARRKAFLRIEGGRTSDMGP